MPHSATPRTKYSAFPLANARTYWLSQAPRTGPARQEDCWRPLQKIKSIFFIFIHLLKKDIFFDVFL